jgi:hypothetical protein
MVGPSVGNADVLSTEGVRLYNQKHYGKAADMLFKAVRANPAQLPPYLALARSLMAVQKTARACQAYRAYLKAAPDSLDRSKAQGEMELCERQLRAAGQKPVENTAKVVEARANFFASLEAGKLVGPGSAAAALQGLLDRGYVGVDLADMGAKLHNAAQAAADDLHQRAIAHEKLTPEQLRSGNALFGLAADTGVAPPAREAKSAFLSGMAALTEGNAQGAEVKFAEAAQGDPSNRDYVFYRSLAVYQQGNRGAALRNLEAELPNDARTAALRTEMAMQNSPQAGADALERALFSHRTAK